MPIINELEKRNVEVVLTARDIYQVRDLLKLFHVRCDLVGGHYGRYRLFKLIGNCLRAVQLAPALSRLRPDLAVSHGSRAQVLVGKVLGIPTLMLHDYEYSTKTGFIEPDWTLMPDVIPDGVMTRTPEHTLKYMGLKEDVYVPRFRPDQSVLCLLGISPEDFVVTLRPPATEAHYHNPESEKLFDAVVRFLISRPRVRLVTLPRNAKQNESLRRKWPDLLARGRMIIPDEAVDGLNLMWFSDLVVSGGGTMNREAAALGVPVYSVFRGKIGAVDRYLAANRQLTLIENVEEIESKIKLVRWNRPTSPNLGARPALTTIVDNIIRVLGSEKTQVLRSTL